MDTKKEIIGRLADMLLGYNVSIEESIFYEETSLILQDYSVAKEEAQKRNTLKKRIVYFLGAKKTDGLSDRTIQNYQQILTHFAEWINKHITQITTDDIRSYITYLSVERKLKESSLQTHINTLRTFFAWMTIEGIIKKNPMLKIKSLKIDKKNARHALSQEELERLRNACKNYREKAIVEFFYSTGCRLTEVVNIRLDELNFEARSVKVIGKGNKERTVYFSVRAKLMIQEYVQQRKGGIMLFPSSKTPYEKMKVRGMQRIIQNVGERAGLSKRVHPHLLRHTFATNAVNAGMDITIIQRLLGHEDVNTTQIYASISQDIVRQAYDRIVS